MWKLLFAAGRAVRETGQALDRVGCRIQGSYAYKEQLSRHRRLAPLQNYRPKLGNDVFVAPNASVIGRVEVGPKSTVWYGSVLRGDVNDIKIGSNSSIGDGCVVHVSSSVGGAPHATTVGDNAVIEQGSILHGCTIGNNANVQMGSVVFDGAVVEQNAVVGAGSMVLAGAKVPEGQLWAGRPAKFVRDLTAEEKASLARSADDQYALAKQHEQEQMKHENTRAEDADKREYWVVEKPEHEARF
mmetsp:Transcript_14855/g.58270  ORF Transcript_14855/g.58270 Transcript_14855/m.58270 type:complete len:243 (+) Transcript_14855:83-811(+)